MMTRDEVIEDARGLLVQATFLEDEARVVHEELSGLWGTPKDPGNRHFPFTSSGLTMCAFGIVDRCARHWFPHEKGTTERMVSFLREYLYPSHSAHVLEIAVQLWRHKSMHNAKLEFIKEDSKIGRASCRERV